MNKSIMLVILAGFVALLIGCHAGGSAPFINTPSEFEIYSKDYDVLENGRFADIYLPSGAVIRCTADHTLKPGTKVTATEQKVANEANSNDGTSSYIYSITGKLYSGDALNTAVAVNSIEKPISVTIPNNSETGLCYLGTRASDNDPWRYTLAQDENQANTRILRLSQTTQKNPTFNLYRLGIQFALFVFKNESREEAQIDSVVVTPDKEVTTKEGKYTGALTVKMNLEGENLNNIDPANLVAKIIYRSENKDGVNINFATNKTDSEDNAVSGTYEHTFEITKIDKTSIGNAAELTFVIELDGVSIEDFPKDFIVELYSKSDDKNTLPFSYTQEFGFETKEQTDTESQTDTNTDTETETQTGTDTETDTESGTDTETGSSTSTGTDTSVEVYSITYDLDGGQLAKENPKTYSVETEDITLNNPTKDGYTFTGWTGTDLDNPSTKVTIEKGSTGDRSYKANWQQNAPDTYTLTLVAGKGIDSVDENKAYKTGEKITLNYTLKDGYEFDKWSDSEGNAVTSPFTMPAKAVTLTASAKVITYNLEYFLDGGYFETDNPKTYTVETENFDLNDPKKDGYVFLGWTSSETTAPLTPVSIKKGSTGDKKFTANWSLINYTLTYNLDSGQLTKDNPTEYTVETKTFTLNEPTKTGYEFIGWTGSNGDTPQKPMSVVQGSKSDLNYVANYSIVNYALTYTNIENCTFATANPATYNVENETFTLNNPTKDDYFFLGWTYEGQTTPQLEVTITKGSTTGDKTYTANWEVKAVASLKSAATDFAVNGQIQIEFDKEITWQDSFKDYITITPTTPTTPITTITINSYSYSNKVLTLTPASKLKYNTGYTVAIAGIEKVSDKNLTFTTVDLAVTPVITSDSTNSPAELNGKFMLQPTFTIDFGKVVVNQESAKSHILLDSSALPNFANLAFSNNGKIATLTFSSNLSVNTAYQLSITGFTDDDNSTISAPSAVSFTTIATEIFGSGTQGSPYLIFTQTDLQKLCDDVYNNGDNQTKPFYFKQMNDIALTEPWTTIGLENDDPFYGIYDGNNHKITGLSTTISKGLFSSITSYNENKSEIKNLTFENVSISGNYEYVGALAGSIYNARITNVHVVGNISIQGSSSVGGLAGMCKNVEISRCSVDSPNGLISVDTGNDVGGLIGKFENSGNSSISESYASVGVKGNNCVGGLMGILKNCNVSNSYANCTITALEADQYNEPYSIGGLVGVVVADNAYFTNCYSKGTIYIESTTVGEVGGLSGKLYGNGQNSTNSFTSVTINVSQDYTYDSNDYNPYNPANGVPLYFSDDADVYVYEDATNKNCLSNGYPATGANWDGWDASVWSGLDQGQFPKLKWQQGN